MNHLAINDAFGAIPLFKYKWHICCCYAIWTSLL